MKSKWTMLLAILALLLAPVAGAQYYEQYLAGNQAGGSVADDTSVALLVRCVNPGADFTLAVAAGGDITFQEDSAAYDGFECPVSGALGGIIDVSDAACDTLGEVVDIINADVNGYCKAVILDGLRADSSNDSLLTFAAADVGESLSLPWDTSVALTQSYALTTKRSIGAYIRGSAGLLVPNPFNGQVTTTHWISALSTYGSGTSTITIQSVDVSNHTAGSSETVTTLYTAAGGATTVTEVENLFPFGVIGRRHEKVLVRLTNSAAMASTSLIVNGIEYPQP